MIDTQGNVYHPIKLDPSVNPFAWTSSTLKNLRHRAGPNTVASDGPTQGGLLLFKMNTAVYSNRPLTLCILGPRARSSAAISLNSVVVAGAARLTRRRWGWVLAVATLALLPSAGLPAVGTGEVERAVQFAAPGTLDVVPPVLAVSGSGAAAAAFGIQDVDTPGVSQGYVSLRPAHGGRGAGTDRDPRIASRSSTPAYDGGSLELLTGDRAGRTRPAVAVPRQSRSARGARWRAPRTLVGGLAGRDPGPAAHARERRRWSPPWPPSAACGSSSRPRATASAPSTCSPTAARCPRRWTPRGWAAQNTIVAWTAATRGRRRRPPRAASPTRWAPRPTRPRGVKTAVTVPAGHRIDELGVAARRRWRHGRLGRELVRQVRRLPLARPGRRTSRPTPRSATSRRPAGWPRG